MDWSDKRLVDQITFALGNPDQERVQTEIRETFKQIGCKTGDDIALVGCTGLAAAGHDIERIKWIRENMAGSGIGLTCFVPPSRFCFVHNTIGGLQEEQEQFHADQVAKISRELHPAEKAKVTFVESVRRIKGKSKTETLQMMKDALGGKKIPDEVLKDLDVDGEAPAPVETDPHGVLDRPAIEMFKCPEHGATMWGCNYCLAELVAKGPYTPNMLFAVALEGNSVLPDMVNNIKPDEIDDKIKYVDENGADTAAVYVQVTRWSRRLARER